MPRAVRPIDIPAKNRERYEPLVGARYACSTNEKIKDSAPERHGLFRCGAFGAACVAVHRSKYSGVASPQARIANH